MSLPFRLVATRGGAAVAAAAAAANPSVAHARGVVHDPVSAATEFAKKTQAIVSAERFRHARIWLSVASSSIDDR